MISSILCFALLANLNAPAQPNVESTAKGPFPLTVGSTWHYIMGDKKVTSKVVAEEKIGGLMCAKIESSLDGNPFVTEHVAMTADGLVRTAYNGQQPDKPVLFLKHKGKKGDTWDIDVKIGAETAKGKFTAGEEEIEVPAGKFKVITSSGEFDINGQKIGFTYYYAEKVGMVKQVAQAGDMKVTLELEKFEPAKK
jgi:hypothetical protein